MYTYNTHYISALLILMVSPITVVYFAILFLVIQQIEGNLIYPHVVGLTISMRRAEITKPKNATIKGIRAVKPIKTPTKRA